MPVSERMRVQAELILHNLEGSAAYPARDQWDSADDIEYLYREYAILTREKDAGRVEGAVIQILDEAGYGDVFKGQKRELRRERVSAGVVRLMAPETPMLAPAILDQLDEHLEPGLGRHDHVAYVCPLMCPIPEPHPARGGSSPQPPPAGSTGSGMTEQDVTGYDMTEQDMTEQDMWARRETGREGEGVSIVIVDTGLMKDAAAGHSWLNGVKGDEEYTYARLGGQDFIAPYSGHGTFVAGVARCMAPRAAVYVERAFAVVGADYETNLLATLERALDLSPHLLAFPFAIATRDDLSPLTFDDLLDRRIRDQEDLVMLAAAGNDNSERPIWPAAYREVIAVGALAINRHERAYFSNYGPWVNVYARGQDLVNAFPVGTYVYHEPPRAGRRAQFEGMAVWGGSSFAVPIVAGLIAARMSVTGENAQRAADSLLRFARDQEVPGVGAVLYPGQALLATRGD